MGEQVTSHCRRRNESRTLEGSKNSRKVHRSWQFYRGPTMSLHFITGRGVPCGRVMIYISIYIYILNQDRRLLRDPEQASSLQDLDEITWREVMRDFFKDQRDEDEDLRDDPRLDFIEIMNKDPTLLKNLFLEGRVHAHRTLNVDSLQLTDHARECLKNKHEPTKRSRRTPLTQLLGADQHVRDRTQTSTW